MTTAIATQTPSMDAGMLERVLVTGDLSKLSAQDRLAYYNSLCESLGLNPLTRPFEYLTLGGKTVLYAKRDATDQLRKIHTVSITIPARDMHDDIYVVTARATDKTGRTDESIGAVTIGGLKGEAKANALMKCETKAKRRVTLSICGLGMLDETEVETIPGAKVGEPEVIVQPKPLLEQQNGKHEPTAVRLAALCKEMDTLFGKGSAQRFANNRTGKSRSKDMTPEEINDLVRALDIELHGDGEPPQVK